MNTRPTAWENDGSHANRILAAQPDFRGIDSPEDFIRDAKKFGVLDQVLDLLNAKPLNGGANRNSIARDIAFELACEENATLAVSLLAYVTGAGEYGSLTLRDYAARCGCSHEWFRLRAERLRARLELDGDSRSSLN